MTTMLDSLVTGFTVALDPTNLLFCTIGVSLGTLVGVLPGLGPVTTMALLLPAVFHLPAEAALMMLSGIYYGAQYGSSTTAILLRIPGEASGVVTMRDGHAMAQQGRAGPALGIAALASLVGGLIAAAVLALLLRPLASLAIAFGPAETAALVLLGAAAAVAMSSGSLLTGWGMLIAGAVLGLVGTDLAGGLPRFTFGLLELSGGISFAPLAVGIFGFAELIRALTTDTGARIRAHGSVWPSRADLRDGSLPALRGSLVGSLIGIVPGGSTLLAALAAYSLEKGISGRRLDFGSGVVAGVAAPEAANNAAAQTAFAPLLAFGLPSNAIMAVMAGAMLMIGIAPGPSVVATRPEIILGLVASMLIGNLILVALNLPLVGIWTAVLRIPMKLLVPPIMVVCCVGIWSINGSVFDVWLLLGFGLVGWLLLCVDVDPTPLLLGFVLAPIFEEAARRALVQAYGDWWVFLNRPWSAGLLAAAVLATLLGIWHANRKGRAT